MAQQDAYAKLGDGYAALLSAREELRAFAGADRADRGRARGGEAYAILQGFLGPLDEPVAETVGAGFVVARVVARAVARYGARAASAALGVARRALGKVRAARDAMPRGGADRSVLVRAAKWLLVGITALEVVPGLVRRGGARAGEGLSNLGRGLLWLAAGWVALESARRI